MGALVPHAEDVPGVRRAATPSPQCGPFGGVEDAFTDFCVCMRTQTLAAGPWRVQYGGQRHHLELEVGRILMMIWMVWSRIFDAVDVNILWMIYTAARSMEVGEAVSRPCHVAVALNDLPPSSINGEGIVLAVARAAGRQGGRFLSRRGRRW